MLRPIFHPILPQPLRRSLHILCAIVIFQLGSLLLSFIMLMITAPKLLADTFFIGLAIYILGIIIPYFCAVIVMLSRGSRTARGVFYICSSTMFIMAIIHFFKQPVFTLTEFFQRNDCFTYIALAIQQYAAQLLYRTECRDFFSKK